MSNDDVTKKTKLEQSDVDRSSDTANNSNRSHDVSENSSSDEPVRRVKIIKTQTIRTTPSSGDQANDRQPRKINTTSRVVKTGSTKISTDSKHTPKSRQITMLDHTSTTIQPVSTASDGSTQISDESMTNMNQKMSSTKVNPESTQDKNTNTESIEVQPISTQKIRIIKIRRRKTSELDESTSAGMENVVQRIPDQPEELRSPVFIPEPDARTMLQAMLVIIRSIQLIITMSPSHPSQFSDNVLVTSLSMLPKHQVHFIPINFLFFTIYHKARNFCGLAKSS